MVFPIQIFRMSHIQNIPHIIIHGITGNKSPNANANYVPIGDASLMGVADSLIKIYPQAYY